MIGALVRHLGMLTTIRTGPALRWPATLVGFTMLAVAPCQAQPTRGSTSRPGLVPQPREVVARGESPLRSGLAVAPPADTADRFAAQDLVDALRARHIRATLGASAPSGAVRVSLLRPGTSAATRALRAADLPSDAAARDQGYILVADSTRVSIIAATSAGMFYGVQTLKQLIDGDGPTARLQLATIRDWPAMRWRGFHDDLSRGPVPTLEFQKKQIRTLATYKLNVYSPYFEHTLEYKAHPLIGPPGGTITQKEMRELVEYARQYHVEVVPEQEAFGHLHHVLKWERYSGLAETPHGHVLAPDDSGAIPLIRQWFAEIDSVFPGRFVHLGADETFELGRGRSEQRVKTEGIGVVYLDFLRRITDALRPTSGSGRRFLFWGDVAMNHPELVQRLPKDLIAVAWEYSPQSQGFDRFLTPFTGSGLETWVAPGVNNWNRVYPNYSLALPNIQGFVRDGQRLGANGMLNTSWDDDGEAIFNQTWYGVLFGAAAAWQPGESSIPDFQRSYGRVFHGDRTGNIDEAQRELMAAHAALRFVRLGEASDYLFWLDPWSEEGQRASSLILPVSRDIRQRAERAIVLIADARAAALASGTALREPEALDAIELGARRIDLLAMKFQFADEAGFLYRRAYASRDNRPRREDVVRDLADVSGINGRFQDLRDAYGLLRALYERAWLAENRPYALQNVLARYDMAMQLWIARADAVTRAWNRWSRGGGPLATPESLGFPASGPPGPQVRP
ncbi:MAG TPA: glycoside hydrolase family 20 zincin-like fold domain-containing protein [Gemmatimonadaceae bacterium]|nr:glycoside hydrolase family 20 zincin-like fold domain-containing protein [Gemmatimonadaceae bacterium]